MKEGPGQKKITIQADPQLFGRQVDELLSSIPLELSGEETASVLQKCKWILIELITNGYKHSGDADTTISMEFVTNGLEIIKEDCGCPLQLVLHDGESLHWPLHPRDHNRNACILKEELNELYLNINQDGVASFTMAALPENEPYNLDNLNEHFGFIIITRLCHSFTYVFEASTGKNIFKAVLSY
ncbi:MAG TPA: hypothetical protein VL098_05295 [Flavipsychrobacter sp.]|nr:hypothetical protein [Flavipsychrobacter sp.]